MTATVSTEGEGVLVHDTSASPFYSIIMPVYGTEDFIAGAIECVIAQTFQDWELIIVDDATPDGAANIAQQYAQQDSRIRLIHHERNMGQSAARNTGLMEASGVYVWFPDSDDTFEPDVLKKAHLAIENTYCDVVIFGLTEVYYGVDGSLMYKNAIPTKAFVGSDAGTWHKRIIEFERDTYFGYVWNKVYKLDIVRQNHIQFAEARLNEDFVFNVEFFKHARSISVLEGSFYDYRKVDGRSLTNANSYSAKEYFDLHQSRISMMRNLLDGWGALDDEAKAILGSLYGRYIFSAFERTYHDGEKLSGTERREWFQRISQDPLFDELIPAARADSSRALSTCLSVLKTKNPTMCMVLAKTMNLARTKLYPVFTRLRSGR